MENTVLFKCSKISMSPLHYNNLFVECVREEKVSFQFSVECGGLEQTKKSEPPCNEQRRALFL